MNKITTNLNANITSFSSFSSKTLKYLPSFEVSLFDDNFNNAKHLNALFLIVDKNGYKGQINDLNSSISAVLNISLSNVDFKGDFAETISCFPANTSGGEFSRIIVVSIGDVEKLTDVEQDYEIGQKIGSLANSLKLKKIKIANISSKQCTGFVSNIYYGICLSNYCFNHYFHKKAESKENHLREVYFFAKPDKEEKLKLKLENKKQIATNLYFAKQLVDTPSTDLNPENYSQIIKSAFDGIKNVEVKILDEDQMAQLGMGSLLAVNAGSINGAKTVIVNYKGNPESETVDLALVGKGVCFDSGGLSIKPANAMEDMKIDMGGSAVCVTSLKLIASLGLKVNVVAAVGLVENLVSGASFRPGDILKSMSGQTIEVLNTDAEGRLVLADVLYYTQKNYKPARMIDFATLTGAVTIALADVYAGIMSYDDDFADDLIKSGSKTADRLWRLPLGKKFDSMIDSNIADVKNVGSGRGGGTVTAGQFLARFVNCDENTSKTKWAHIDIAGVAYDGKYGGRSALKGATGFGLELIYKFVCDNLLKD